MVELGGLVSLYVILEVCVLSGVCCVIYLVLHSRWSPADGFANLRLLAFSVNLVLLAAAVLEHHNLKHHLSILSNSPFLFLISVNTVIPLKVVTCFSSRLLVCGLKSLDYDLRLCLIVSVVIGCSNILALDVYTLGQQSVSLSDLPGEVWSGVVSFTCVCVLFCIAVCLLHIGLYLLLLWVNVAAEGWGWYFRDKETEQLLLLVENCYASGLILWVMFIMASSLGAGTFVYVESVLRRFYCAVPVLLVVLALLSLCWFVRCLNEEEAGVVDTDYTGALLFACILVVFTTLTTAAVVGTVSDTPLSEWDRDIAGPSPEQSAEGELAYCPLTSACDRLLITTLPPTQAPPLTRSHVPPDPSSTPSPATPTPPLTTPTQRCREIDREDPRAMELGQLVHLDYLDQEGERRALKVMDEVAGSWKKLGTLFNYDVNRIAGNHMGGDYAMDCCLEVLGRWFRKGRARGYPLSWSGLIQALRDIDLDRVADDIDIALKCVLEVT